MFFVMIAVLVGYRGYGIARCCKQAFTRSSLSELIYNVFFPRSAKSCCTVLPSNDRVLRVANSSLGRGREEVCVFFQGVVHRTRDFPQQPMRRSSPSSRRRQRNRVECCRISGARLGLLLANFHTHQRGCRPRHHAVHALQVHRSWWISHWVRRS